MILRKAASAFAGGALALMAVGCSNSSEPASRTTSASTVATAAALGEVEVGDLPLSWYLDEASAQREVIHAAESRLIAECMDTQGFEYLSVPYRADQDFLGKRFGVTPDIADRIGFQSLDALNPAAEPMPAVPDPGPAYHRALIGEAEAAEDVQIPGTGISVTLVEGCSGQARRTLFGSDEAALDFARLDQRIQRLDLDALSGATASQAVQEALEMWRACMADRGLAFDSRESLLNIDWAIPRPGEEERRAAVADAECLQEAGYAKALSQELRTRQLELIDEAPGLIDEFTEVRDSVLTTARAISGR